MRKLNMKKKSQPHNVSQGQLGDLATLQRLCLHQANELAAEKKRREMYETIASGAKHGLTFAQNEWKLRFDGAQAEIARVKADYALLEQRSDELVGVIKLRFKELAVLTKLLYQQQH